MLQKMRLFLHTDITKTIQILLKLLLTLWNTILMKKMLSLLVEEFYSILVDQMEIIQPMKMK